jgi:hypothetical protein
MILPAPTETFDVSFTVNSVVACDCGEFPSKIIFWPQHLNEIAVELAQRLRQVLLGSCARSSSSFCASSCNGHTSFCFASARWMSSFSLEPPDCPDRVARIRYSVVNSSMSDRICRD